MEALILVGIGVWLVLALRFSVRKGGGCGSCCNECAGCSGCCESCRGGEATKVQPERRVPKAVEASPQDLSPERR